jgi:hypothetical protein
MWVLVLERHFGSCACLDLLKKLSSLRGVLAVDTGGA